MRDAGPGRMSHIVFLATILAKGALGLVQLATAAALYFGLAERLPTHLQNLLAAELVEDPSDYLAARIMAFAGALPQTDLSFYTVYFAAHGLLHVGIVAALLYGAAWAYGSSIIVLAVFIAYQLLEWAHVGGAMLLVLSAIDLAVILLTLIEWRQRRQAPLWFL